MISPSMRNLRRAVILTWLTRTGSALAGPSVYPTAPDDPKAVTVRAVGNGMADDSAAIQQALDAVSNRGAGGIVYLPSGRYRPATGQRAVQRQRRRRQSKHVLSGDGQHRHRHRSRQ